MENIIFIVILIFLSIPCISLIMISVELHFLKFKIENHPILIKIVEDALYNICKTESITVFNISYNELNINRTKENKIVGKYVYTINNEYQQKLNKILSEIELMEQDYELPYNQICALVGHETKLTREDFILPKILLAEENLKAFGLTSYYDTFFHELGHHFAVKEIGVHDEADADRYGAMLARKYLPSYFFLFHSFAFRFTKDGNGLRTKEKFKAYYEYLLYLKNNKNG